MRKSAFFILAGLGFVAAGSAYAAGPPAVARGVNVEILNLRFDNTGATRLIEAVRDRNLTDGEAAKLLELSPIQAMVDNTLKYSPGASRLDFLAALRQLLSTGTISHQPDFRLDLVLEKQGEVLRLLRDLTSRQPKMSKRITAAERRYAPDMSPVAVTAHFIVGGSSDGFAISENSGRAQVFIALDVAKGDPEGVENNLTHEIYHILQQSAANGVPGWAPFFADRAKIPDADRLIDQTLQEGSANLVSDASRATGSGPYIGMWRDRALFNARPDRIAENFSLFDLTLDQARTGKIDWQEINRRGFRGSNGKEGAQFYFVGFEIAKAIERYHGPRAVGRIFNGPPLETYREYIRLYRLHPEIRGRFSPETEEYLNQDLTV